MNDIWNEAPEGATHYQPQQQAFYADMGGRKMDDLGSQFVRPALLAAVNRNGAGLLDSDPKRGHMDWRRPAASWGGV